MSDNCILDITSTVTEWIINKKKINEDKNFKNQNSLTFKFLKIKFLKKHDIPKLQILSRAII